MNSFESNPRGETKGNALPDNIASDLDWLALCYLTDDLDSARRAAFEQGLANNQAYREALARAVELNCAVVAEFAEPSQAMKQSQATKQGQSLKALPEKQVVAPRVVAVRPAERWIQAATWFAIATAASLAFAVVYWAMNPTATDVAKRSRTAVSSQTALLWSQVREAEPAAEVDLFRAELAPLNKDETVALDEEEEYSAASQTELPSWLLTAVSIRSDAELDANGELDSAGNVQPSPTESRLPEDL